MTTLMKYTCCSDTDHDPMPVIRYSLSTQLPSSAHKQNGNFLLRCLQHFMYILFCIELVENGGKKSHTNCGIVFLRTRKLCSYFHHFLPSLHIPSF